ncbi:hypothetical protein [Burkholderia sp. Ac-20365]|uniref:hypothetical protein n=1 Tax=Burkholderia sp. Ac-20365 TaxID=2703897 RepID=UPI00197C0313|nr:hypothetical protein [Burkholderia sp. Ac-20365]MBN3760925.1 hypothetical protein [Burkholderia sp. Ac-20365]
MKTMLAVSVLTTSLLASHVAHAEGRGRYVMLESEMSMDQAISRWAAQSGRSAKWEARDYVDVGDPAALNRTARLADAADIGDATARLLKQAPEEVTFFACVYSKGSVAVVVRQKGQPPCEDRS